MSLQKRYEALHKNVGQSGFVSISIDLYLYNSENKKNLIAAEREFYRLQIQSILAIFIPGSTLLDDALYWEEEEENHKAIRSEKQVEKRLRSKEILTLQEVQQREADQLKQLQSEFKSELEIERNRQDRCLKKMLVPDEEVPAFQLSEVEEISFTDGKSIHPYPTITIGLSHRADFDGNENVLIQSEKLKMQRPPKYCFCFGSDRTKHFSNGSDCSIYNLVIDLKRYLWKRRK